MGDAWPPALGDTMSEDEFFFFIFILIGAVLFWWIWYASIRQISRLIFHPVNQAILKVTPAVAAVGLALVLFFGAAHDVRDSVFYLLFYFIMGMMWLGIGPWLMRFLGVLWLDDSLEKRNPGAALIVAAGMLAMMAIFAGANIGDGPGWWVVLIAALIGAVPWLLLAVALQVLFHLGHRVTVDRDFTLGLRFGAYLVATGLICAYGAAGDYTDAWTTVLEFSGAWPVLLLGVHFASVETIVLARRKKARVAIPARRALALSVALAVAYLVFAVVVIVMAPAPVFV